jgi:lipoate-protein ligase A
MRIDGRLLEDQKDPTAVPVLRFFRWRGPTLSFGRLQNSEALRALGFEAEEAVRRPTGGGAVLHGQDLSLSLVWRRDHPHFPKCLKNIYRGLHETVQQALQRRGMATILHQSPEDGKSSVGICFSEPVENDLTRNGQKILGGALRVTGWGRLYQGNILVEQLGLAWEALAEALAEEFEKTFFYSKPLSLLTPQSYNF